jgi:6-phosphofructokinase 1
MNLSDRWGRRFAIVVVAEGAHIHEDSSNYASCEKPSCGIGQLIADELSNCSHKQIDIRASVLEHIQRGGIPSALDRLVATAFGKAAVDLIAGGKSGQMVAWQNGEVVAVRLEAVLTKSPSLVDPNNYLVETARSLGIYVGNVLK